ncbi:MAG: phosphatase PAP2 family protein [Acidobacteria bacterium]|nr:phosphatase PAP2 family protein [Acidobacteriota bacterium]MBI3279144.1 phosphatase PAP2 family protein [Acidobacteriota bacterium]
MYRRFIILLLAASCAAAQTAADAPNAATAESDTPAVEAAAKDAEHTSEKVKAITVSEDPRDRLLFTTDRAESFKTVTIKTFKNSLLDQREIWTTAFRFNRSNAKFWIGIGATTAALVAMDSRLSRQLPNSQDQMAFSEKISKVGAAYTAYPIAAGFYLMGAVTGNARATETGALGLVAVTDSLILSQALKTAFSRQRPMDGDGKGLFFKGAHNSFPSGHSMMSFALASVVANEYSGSKLVPVIAYGAAGLISASRFSARRHFASDIVAGAAMGWLLGHHVFHTNQRHREHQSAARKLLTPELKPYVNPSSASVGLSLAWGK